MKYIKAQLRSSSVNIWVLLTSWQKTTKVQLKPFNHLKRFRRSNQNRHFNGSKQTFLVIFVKPFNTMNIKPMKLTLSTHHSMNCGWLLSIQIQQNSTGLLPSVRCLKAILVNIRKPKWYRLFSRIFSSLSTQLCSPHWCRYREVPSNTGAATDSTTKDSNQPFSIVHHKMVNSE